MAKRPSVGTSAEHTPIKHAIMREFVAKECRAANFLPRFTRLVWVDLTAGAGQPFGSAAWTEACSPGILASRATQSGKPVMVELCERSPEIHAELLANLADNLPALGYNRTSQSEWTNGRATVRAWNGNGRRFDPRRLPGGGAICGGGRGEKGDAVLVLNDPNSITDWAMDRYLTGRLAGMAAGARTLSCLGFNAGSVKRNPFERDGDFQQTDSVSTRSEWYGLIGSITDYLPERLDLLLAGFTRDSSQWTYLFTAPEKWRHEEETVIADAFNALGEPRDYEFAWFRQDREKFNRLVDRRILTKTELQDRQEPKLPFASAIEEGAV